MNKEYLHKSTAALALTTMLVLGAVVLKYCDHSRTPAVHRDHLNAAKAGATVKTVSDNASVGSESFAARQTDAFRVQDDSDTN